MFGSKKENCPEFEGQGNIRKKETDEPDKKLEFP
jgi:hypothetical protein